MSHTAPTPSRTRLMTIIAALLVLFVGTVAWTQRPPDVAEAHPGHTSATVPRTEGQQALHDTMRALWEDHVTWTRLAIVTFAAGAPGFETTATRLLENQAAIGDAIRPFYGDAAADRLTGLLHDHITIAVEVMQGAQAGDTTAFQDAKARWYANGNDIADFLATANPEFWPRDAMRTAMKDHLDQTLSEAAHELGGDYQASIRDYAAARAHILMMADTLSGGLIGAFHGTIK